MCVFVTYGTVKGEKITSNKGIYKLSKDKVRDISTNK